MAQTITITLTTAGLGTGPFDLYSNIDGYTTPFETGLDRFALTEGYLSILVPDETTVVRIQSVNKTCDNYVDASVTAVPTTTTTTTSTTTTTTTATPSYTLNIYGSYHEVLTDPTQVNIYYALGGDPVYTFLGSISSEVCSLIDTLTLPAGTQITFYTTTPPPPGTTFEPTVTYYAQDIASCGLLEFADYCKDINQYVTTVNSNMNTSIIAAAIGGELRYC